MAIIVNASIIAGAAVYGGVGGTRAFVDNATVAAKRFIALKKTLEEIKTRKLARKPLIPLEK